MVYRKIPKMSPGAYIFQRPFLKGLYIQTKICVSKSASLILGGKYASQLG